MNKLIKNLTVAAAISIAIIGVYTPATASANGGSWQRDSVGWWYKNSNGSYPKNDWQRIDGKWYYFDGRGYITHSKWERIKDYWYYFNTSGHMIENAWEMIGDKWYYFDNKGHMLSNQWVGDYYVGRDGYMLKNTITPDNYVVGSDGKWDKRFSRELAEKAKSPLNNLYKADRSKYSVAGSLTFGKRNEYNTALQLLETIYPEYNAVDNAKRAIKKIVDNQNSSNNPKEFRYSKYSIVQSLTYREVSENTHGAYMFSEEEVNKAFAALSSEINFSKFFKDEAIKKLQNIEHVYSISSKIRYEKYLTSQGFTKEEIDNAFKSVKIDFVKNAQHVANRTLHLNKKSIDSRSYIIKYLTDKTYGYQFTKEEAEEGVNRLNYDFKINLRNLIEINFITNNDISSRESIVAHIVRYNLFEESETREVLKEYNINYTERARLRAIDILKNGKYSRSNLIKTLTDPWKFTEEEATNAVKNLKHENLID